MGSQAIFHEFNNVYSKDQMYTKADHAGPGRYECNPGTSCGTFLPLYTSFGTRGAALAAIYRFCNTKTTKNHKRGKVWSNTVNWTISNNFFEFLSYKNGNGRQNLSLCDKTAPRVPKVGFKGGRVQQLSARVTLVPSEAGMVRHIREHTKKCPLNGSVPLSPNFFLECSEMKEYAKNIMWSFWKGICKNCFYKIRRQL